jgi:6-methylsalicylate decarboxylase
MRIDVHAHYFPKAYLKRMESLNADPTAGSHRPLATDDPGDVEQRLMMMDAAGVDMQLLSVSATLPYLEREEAAVDAAREANDLYAELIERYPQRFKGFVAVPLPHVDAALRELERGMDKLGMIGATMGTSVVARSAADQAFEPFYAEMNRRGAPLFVHPGGCGMCSPLIEDYGLRWSIGAPLEDTMFMMHVIQRRIPIRYPNVKIIVAHLGGAYPMLVNRLDDGARYVGVDPISPIARRMWYDTVAQGNTHALKCAYAAYGPERLVHGSDYPWQLHDEYLNSVKYVQESGLPQKDIDAILDHNAARMLGWEK